MAIIKNTTLVRYEGGYVDVFADQEGDERVEEFLQLANVRTKEGAESLARQRLRLLRTEQRTRVFQGDVNSTAQAYGIGFRLGDKFDGQMISSVRLEVDTEGTITTIPETDDPVTLAEEVLARKIDRIAKGVPSEYANPFVEKQDEGTGTDTTPPAFSHSGPLSMDISPLWAAPRPYWISWLEVELGSYGFGSTIVQILRPGGALVGQTVVGGGDTRAVGVINKGIKTGEKIALYIPSFGFGSADLTATLRGTMV